MVRTLGTTRRHVLGILLIAGGCSSIAPQPPSGISTADAVRVVNRLTWGANGAVAHALAEKGLPVYLDSQLHPPAGDPLPEGVSFPIGALASSPRAPSD